MNWYYALGDQRQGPLTEAEFEALIASGTIHENTLVWKDGMANWAPLKEVRPAGASAAPPGWIRCTATGRYFPPEEIVYLDGKPYSAAAKATVLQGVMQSGSLPDADFNRTGPPWENRIELGFFKAIWLTVKGVLLEPVETFATMKREGGLGAPLLYNVACGWAFGLLGIVCNLFSRNTLTSFFSSEIRESMEAPLELTNIGWILLAVFFPLLIVLGAFIVSGVIHLALMLFGGARQPFRTTLRTHCYASGSVILFQLIPFCGGFITLIWYIVAMCIGLAKAHETPTGRSVGAVLLAIGVCCVATIVFYEVLIAFLVTRMRFGVPFID